MKKDLLKLLDLSGEEITHILNTVSRVLCCLFIITKRALCFVELRDALAQLCICLVDIRAELDHFIACRIKPLTL